MKPSKHCYDIIRFNEHLALTAYCDKAGYWTIGYGNRYYANGNPVKIGDKITKARAERLLQSVVNEFAWYIDKLLVVKVNQFQFDALVSFAYDVGFDLDLSLILEDLCVVPLLDMINENPDNPLIRHEFLKWNKITVNGIKTVLPSLDLRRKAEANLYFMQVNGFHMDEIKFA
jgi:lysozyme